MLNRVTLTGRLAAESELRYTQSGTARVNFRLAVKRRFKNQQTGEQEADFINCQIWRKSAENFANFTHKGSLVGIDGRLQTSHYTGQDGKEVYRTDVVVENFALLEPRSSQPANGNSYQNSQQQSNQWSNYNQPAQNGTGNQFGGNGVGSDPREPGTWGPNYVERAVDTENLPFGNQPQPQQSETEQTTLDDVPF